MGKIINHEYPEYIRARNKIGINKYNGAYYYSIEICENIIPHVKTDRNWITVELKTTGLDHAIVFVHNRLHPEWYEHYREYDDVVFVCSVQHMCDKLQHLGKTILLPLSVDVEHVERFKRQKDRDVAFVGRRAKLHEIPTILPPGIDYLCGMPRDELLAEMARYKRVYAVDRCAIEAKILGCEVLPYEPGNMVDVWPVLDNKESAVMLQKALDVIDG